MDGDISSESILEIVSGSILSSPDDSIFDEVFDWIANALRSVVDSICDWFSRAWDAIKEGLVAAWQAARARRSR